MDKKVEIYCCYAHEDHEYLQKLKAQLTPFLHRGLILFWDNTNISPGTLWQDEVNKHLATASIVLLLISADFMKSDYCYSEEMKRAMQLHEKGTVRVIPIILRPVAWQEAPFGKLQVLPTGSKPVSRWGDADEGFLDIVRGIEKVVNECLRKLYSTQAEDKAESSLNLNASVQLEQIIRDFKLLSGQIASIVSPMKPKEVTLEKCENQYNKLYGDTMVFLTAYLPERMSNDSEGFVETVSRKRAELLSKGNLFDSATVSFTRWAIPWLATLEKLGMQVKACIATLELYKQKYFPVEV